MARQIPHATFLESLRFSAAYTLPALLRGPYLERPAMARLLAWLDTNAAAQRVCRELRARYGGRAVYVRNPRTVLLILSQSDIRDILTCSDAVFSLRTKAKRAGLRLTQPNSVLLSQGELRRDRRRFNEAVLQAGQVPHVLAPRLRQVLGEELDGVLGHVPGEVDWARLSDAYGRAVLRLVLGDRARDDVRILEALRELRAEANWMGLRPWRANRVRALRQILENGIERHVAAETPGSLAGLFAAAPQTTWTYPAGQVSHWLMAAGSIEVRALRTTLALLAGHPEQAARARAEARADDGMERLGACLCESLRLYPMVPTLFRTVTRAVDWHGARLPPGIEVVIPLAVHHRSPQLEYADTFTPEVWLDGRVQADWRVAPFSGGPGRCPGAELGVQIAATALRVLLSQYDFHPAGPALSPDRPLPKTLDPAFLRLHAYPPR